MGTMTDYTIYCTNTQTDKALALGAPIEFQEDASMDDGKSPIRPTAEQMIGWLESHDSISEVIIATNALGGWFSRIHDADGEAAGIDNYTLYISRKKATLAAIDAALDYLSQNKK